MSDAAPDDLIVLKSVSRRYPAHGDAPVVRALRKVSMTVQRGSRVAVRGESGSGKSTLLNLLGGLDVADSGEVWVDGRNLSDLGERDLAIYRARTVGFVFQTFQLLPTLSARENVELPMEALYVPAKQRRERAEQLLEAVGMARRANHRPGKMSGGEQQRVAIARALANKPALVLADEPTGNLDRKSRRTVVDLLTRLNREFGTTLVIVTHDPNVSGQCELVHVLRRGQIKNAYRPKPSGPMMDAADPADEEDEDAEEEDSTDADRLDADSEPTESAA
jgi:putative ABC transport system ATP-binding protein